MEKLRFLHFMGKRPKPTGPKHVLNLLDLFVIIISPKEISCKIQKSKKWWNLFSKHNGSSVSQALFKKYQLAILLVARFSSQERADVTLVRTGSGSASCQVQETWKLVISSVRPSGMSEWSFWPRHAQCTFFPWPGVGPAAVTSPLLPPLPCCPRSSQIGRLPLRLPHCHLFRLFPQQQKYLPARTFGIFFAQKQLR